MTDATNADDEARALFLGTAPEQSEAIAKLLERTQYERAHDRPAMYLEAGAFLGKGLVLFTDRTMQQVWLVAYLGWRTLHEQSGFVIVSLANGRPYDVRGHESDGFTGHVDRLGQALAELRNAASAPGIRNLPWPADVPRLDPGLSNLRGKEERLAYDLACFAGAFLLLHETCHAQKRVRGEPVGGVTEEMECDRFAIDFLFDGCAEYAQKNNHAAVDVQRKRAMGLFLGLAVILESTEHGLWLPSVTHPPLYERLKQLLDVVGQGFSDPNDPFWVFAACVLLSKLRRDGRRPLVIDLKSCRDLVLILVGRLKLPDSVTRQTV